MLYAMVICKSGVMYSGELLQEYSDDMKWLGIKPSPASDICLYFAVDRIKKIYFQNGSSVTRTESSLTEEELKDEDLKKEGLKDEGLEKEDDLDLDIPDNSILLIRVKGGISFRGQQLEQIEKDNLQKELSAKDALWNKNFCKEVLWEDGYWISPGTIQGTIRETIIHIPEHEVERVYSM